MEVKLHQLKIPLKTSFKTSYGEMDAKEFLLIELIDCDGIIAYGEVEAFARPDYTEETIETAYNIITTFLIPGLQNWQFTHPQDFREKFKWIRGNQMAKAGIEMALWDLYAKKKEVSLQELIGGTKQKVAVGVSLGIQENETALLNTIRRYVQKGYQRVKLKIQPGKDIRFIAAAREAFPNLTLMADANSAYKVSDIVLLKKLDQFNLAMIEQPFSEKDFIDHAELQKQIKTAICLDENLRSLEDVRQAHLLGSCKAINLKLARVGGYSEALDIINYCHQNNLLVWCGGMLEAGIGRAHNLLLASREEFVFPGDISASSRYFEEDIICEPFELIGDSLQVPKGFGIGVTLNNQVIKRFLKNTKTMVLR